MPTYDYECDSCGHRFEAFQKMSDTPLDTCPECGKRVRRVLSGGVGISFRGSGFYVTDSAKKAPEKKKADSSSSKSGS
ncbi:MAG TPA: zinc ribbon domain-containing protein [Treponemataceae bacterium]|nr:zinc ribbon domain-containing protein [Treponemataceae bacterium]HOS35861.1 zinc ribbon domain-containing protein [Treponemataceae bacterium]